jgi:hypothetical protein
MRRRNATRPQQVFAAQRIDLEVISLEFMMKRISCGFWSCSTSCCRLMICRNNRDGEPER